ncbi:hypothetical protein GHT06_022493 [Daphnia sinensis]|uniref:Uncharacterized protein n=1 Tax=Daphnia sinensis TaxID=1820382 RepID=A0AAD5KH46_9CRUS|nr:hypothetical protein GHT06_022493 [Daphnia sinensis]
MDVEPVGNDVFDGQASLYCEALLADQTAGETSMACEAEPAGDPEQAGEPEPAGGPEPSGEQEPAREAKLAGDTGFRAVAVLAEPPPLVQQTDKVSIFFYFESIENFENFYAFILQTDECPTSSRIRTLQENKLPTTPLEQWLDHRCLEQCLLQRCVCQPLHK